MKDMDAKVGLQKFTYGELKSAWEDLRAKLPESGVYDIRNGYSLTEDRDCNANQWWAGWNFDEVCLAVESAKGEITFGDMEVYENIPGEAFPADHGIFFEDGKIERVY